MAKHNDDGQGYPYHHVTASAGNTGMTRGIYVQQSYRGDDSRAYVYVTGRTQGRDHDIDMLLDADELNQLIEALQDVRNTEPTTLGRS